MLKTSHSMQQSLLLKWLVLLFLLLLIGGQLLLKREQFYYLLGWQILLYGLLIYFFKNREVFTLQQLIIIGAIGRVAAAFTVPTLSDDIYRFIWDGQLSHTGSNPLLSTPDIYLQQLSVTNSHSNYFHQLHGLINHPQYYTCYPPLMQLFFWISSFIGGYNLYANIIIVKLLIAIVDVGCIAVLAKLLPYFKLPVSLVVLYAFNPSVIIEGSGNAHFEVVQVALICTAIYLILSKKFIASALVFGLAIITKLIPILLLPLWIRYLGFKKGIIFCIIASFVAVISFLPFVNAAFLEGFSKSIGLYFQSFEFNASLYYLARKIGFMEKGFNYISVLGPALMIRFLSIYAIVFFVWQKITVQQLVTLGMVILTMFYGLSTTVHPWYIINLLPFALLGNRLYVLIWLGIAFLSYNAYQLVIFTESTVWLLIEYSVVLFFIIINKPIIFNKNIL